MRLVGGIQNANLRLILTLDFGTKAWIKLVLLGQNSKQFESLEFCPKRLTLCHAGGSFKDCASKRHFSKTGRKYHHDWSKGRREECFKKVSFGGAEDLFTALVADISME